MVFFVLVKIRYLCGVLRIPVIVYNIGGTGCDAFFQVLDLALTRLPPQIRNLVFVIGYFMTAQQSFA